MDEQLSQRVIGCALNVSRHLGHGFLEKVYEEALAIEMYEADIPYARQRNIVVRYRDRPIGSYCCDFVVGNRLLLELKALSALHQQHEAQVMNYLKACDISVALLFNFGTPTLGIRRIVHNYDDHKSI